MKGSKMPWYHVEHEPEIPSPGQIVQPQRPVKIQFHLFSPLRSFSPTPIWIAANGAVHISVAHSGFWFLYFFFASVPLSHSGCGLVCLYVRFLSRECFAKRLPHQTGFLPCSKLASLPSCLMKLRVATVGYSERAEKRSRNDSYKKQGILMKIKSLNIGWRQGCGMTRMWQDSCLSLIA